VLRGYIDESYDSRSAVPEIFALSCLIGADVTWPFLEWDWLACIDYVNHSLRVEGRGEISRYKAADCSSLEGEFHGWSVAEQKLFVSSLFKVFEKHRLDLIGISVNIPALVKEIPEITLNPVGFAYVLLLQMLMMEIGDFTLSRHPDALISLFHDRCRYDAALLEAFNHMLSDPMFKYPRRFTTITPMGWEHCIPLQPADLVAYEHFKESERRLPTMGRKRRKSLEILLDFQSLGMRGLGIENECIGALKHIMESLDDTTKAILLATARIPTTKKVGV
jgi:hypothetical protein